MSDFKKLCKLLMDARFSAAEDTYELLLSPTCSYAESRVAATQNLIHDAIKMLDDLDDIYDIYTIELAKERK